MLAHVENHKTEIVTDWSIGKIQLNWEYEVKLFVPLKVARFGYCENLA